MINPNNITNVSFAASPALQAILNANNVGPINAVNSATPVTTDSYIAQQQAQTSAAPIQFAQAQAQVVTAPLEFTPKTDVYEPMHKKSENKADETSKNPAKTAAKTAGVGIAVLLAAVLFAPKLAHVLLGNVDATQPLVRKGKEAFTPENIKLAAKKTANLIENYEKKIVNSKAGEFVKAQVSNVISAFKKDGAIGVQAKKLLSHLKKTTPSA